MSRLIDRLRLRLASLFSGDRVDASLKGEIELHLQEQIDENVAAGMSPAEARAAALRAFGPVGVIEEQCRDTRRVAFVEHLSQDLRYTLRSLLRQPMRSWRPPWFPLPWLSARTRRSSASPTS